MNKAMWLFLPFLLFSLLFQLALWPRRVAPPEFDPVSWREHAKLHDEVMSEQAMRLLNGQKLNGKTRKGVIELLGSENLTRWPDGREDPQGSDMVYQLGAYGFGGAAYQWLVVRIGPGEQVSECFILRR